MKIIIHGATGGSNFGDVLFASLFFEKISEVNPKNDNLFFELPKIGVSEFTKKEIKYSNSFSIKDIFRAEALVLISGGFFGERNNTFGENIFRFLRYFPVSLIFMIRKKPIYISGVGGGPLSNILLRKSMSFIMDKATLVTVRDSETKQYFIDYGVTNDLMVTSDTAQIISKETLPTLDSEVKNALKLHFEDKKIILLHLYGKNDIDINIFEKVFPAVKEFLISNPDYGLVITTDWVFDLHHYYDWNSYFENIPFYLYSYVSAWQLCSLLEYVDLIVTPKLHLGILGSTFSKSVVSVPMHVEKTMRYYKQIGEENRCISLDMATTEDVYNLLNIYKNKPIKLSTEILNAAHENIKLIQENILALNKASYK